MDTKQRSLAPFAAIGIFLGAIVPIVIAIAVFMDGTWTFGTSPISDLGISKSTAVANLFNWTCIISGVLIAIIGLAKLFARDGLDSATGFFVTFAGALFAATGIVTATSSYHNAIVFFMLAFALLAMLVSMFADWGKDRKLTMAVTFGLLVIGIGASVGFSEAALTVIMGVMFFAWLLVQSLSMAFSKS